jgi:amino acid adenylation domain-containing protein
MQDWVPTLSGAAVVAPETIVELIDNRFSSEPTEDAVVTPSKAMTYGELGDASATVAGALLDAKVGRGELVLVHSSASSWAVAAMLGVLRAGAQFAMIDTSFPPNRQTRMIESSAARWRLVEPGYVADAASATAWEDLGGVAVAVDSEGTPSTTVTPSAEDPAYTCFTSGSTGVPKGVVVSHRALTYSTMARLQHYSDPVRGFVLCSSLSFDSAYAGIFWTLVSGGVILMPSTRPGDLLAIGRMTTDPRASHTLMVPSLYSVALNGGMAAKLSGLRTVIVAGESCPPGLVRKHFELLAEVDLYNEYGPTECAVWSTAHRCVPDDAASNTVPIGGPIPGVNLYVRGSDDAPAVDGQVGELWIGGPTVASGYSGMPEADTAPFVNVDSERRYRTGDLVGVSAASGLLEYRGRVDRQVKVAGMRLELEEIEAILTEHPDVIEAGIGVHAVDGRTALLAVVAATGMAVAKLRAHLLASLPAGAVPAGFEFVDHVPRQPNGKLDRRALDDRARSWVSARLAQQQSPAGV